MLLDPSSPAPHTHPTPAPPARLFKRPSDRPGTTRQPSKGVATNDDDGRALVCAACLGVVTRASARMEMAGSHAHTFANPHGFVFHIGCFAAAPGCEAVGTPSPEFSWFAGYAWQVAVCRGCGEHLGWHFRSTDRSFHGLIVDRLAESGESGSPH